MSNAIKKRKIWQPLLLKNEDLATILFVSSLNNFGAIMSCPPNCKCESVFFLHKVPEINVNTVYYVVTLDLFVYIYICIFFLKFSVFRNIYIYMHFLSECHCI